MGKIVIYRDYDVRESVILGVSKSFPNNYRVSYTDTHVIIKSLQRNKNDLNIRWQQITDQDGTVFATFDELKAYLTIVFEPFIFRETEFTVEDNIPTNVAVITLPNTGVATTFGNILTGLNAISFDVESFHVPLFTYTDYKDNIDGTGLDIYRTTRFLRSGSGSFGVNGTPLTIGDIGDIVETKKLTADNVDADLEALGEVVELGDIGSSTLSDYINSTTNPEYALEENIIYFFTFTKDGVDYTYLFEGDQPVTLGTGNTQVTEEDFKLISKNGVEATELESNIPNIILDFVLPNTGVPSTYQDMVDALNANTFTVLTKEVPMFSYTEYKYNFDKTALDLYTTVRFFKGGAGTFGLNNTPVTVNDIGTIVETEPLNPTNTDLNVIGQVIELGDTGGINLDTFLNTTNNPEYDLNGDDLYFFTFTKDLIDYTYLYEGVQPALLGNGNTQVTMDDFKLISRDGDSNVEVEKFELPIGRKDQLYFIKEDGTNEVLPDWLMKKGIVVQTEREYEVASTQAVSLEEVFKTWRMFSHYDNSVLLFTSELVSPPHFPALTPEDENPETRLTSDDFYNGELWIYDSVNDRIALTRNVHPYTGFVSPRAFGNFKFEATFSSPDIDDDFLALVIGFYIDPITKYEHTLSVIRSLNGVNTYSVVKNYNQLTQEIIVDGVDLAPSVEGGWNVNSPTRVSVIRTGNTYSIKCSQFQSTEIDDTTEIILDVASDPRLEGFTVATKVAFAARSQVDAYFSDVVFTGLVDYIFYKKGNTYETYEYNFDTEEYFLQNPQTVFAPDYFGANRFIDSYLFNKIYFVTENNELINIKGDNGISWDANNALTLGSDLRPYLDASLLGGESQGLPTELLSFNKGYISGLDFKPFAKFRYQEQVYEDTRPITASNGDTVYDRFDLFVINLNTKQIELLEGTPADNPQLPDYDATIYINTGISIRVSANQTVPDGLDFIQVYAENEGAPAEFNAVPIGLGVNPGSTTAPNNGTKNIHLNGVAMGYGIEFTPENPVSIAQIESFQYFIRNTIFGAGDHYIVFRGLQSNGRVDSVYLPNPINAGYDATSLNYQLINLTIPKSKLETITSISLISGEDSLNIYVDDIKLVTNSNNDTGNSLLTAEYVRAEDEKYLQLAKDYADSIAGSTYVSLVPQVIDLGDIGTDLIQDAFNTDALALDIIITHSERTLIKAIQDGVEREWLFIGKEQTYDGTTVLADADDLFLGGKGVTPGEATSENVIKKIDIFSTVAENANSPLSLPSYDGTTQGTHPSVIDFLFQFNIPLFNGYRYWMAYTPYPNGTDDFENPCILASNDRKNWVVPTGLINPIEPEPIDGTYYADTHLLYDDTNNRLICYWRGFKPGLTEFYVWAKTSLDGITWNTKINTCTLTNGGGSPVIIKNGNDFELYSIDFLTGTPHTINKITSLNPLSFDYLNSEELTYEGIPNGYEIWHFDIYNLKGVLYCVMTVCLEGTNGNGCVLIFGIVENDHFKFVDYPFLEPEIGWTNQRLYRASIVPLEITDEGINWAMWYGATNSSNSWNIGYTELATYYSNSYPEILPKNIKKDIRLHEFFNKKTIVVQGDISVTIPQNLSKFFNLKYDVLLNSTLSFISEGIGFSGYRASIGNKYGELYKLNKDTVRFLTYGIESSGGGTNMPTGTVSVITNESNALPNPPNPTGIYMSPDGLKLFVSDLGNGANYDDRIVQYELTIPFDASTMNLTPIKEYPLGPVVSMSILSVWMNDDGTELLGGFGSPEPNGILRYSLNTGFDLDTINFESSTEFLQPANPRGIQFDDTGTRLYLSAMDSTTIFRYSLLTPYDLSTAELDQQFTSSATNAAIPAIYMSNNGKTLCALDFNNKVLRLIRLDTPYNLTTAIAEQTIALGGGGYSGMFISPDEKVLMLLNYTTKKIERRELSLDS